MKRKDLKLGFYTNAENPALLYVVGGGSPASGGPASITVHPRTNSINVEAEGSKYALLFPVDGYEPYTGGISIKQGRFAGFTIAEMDELDRFLAEDPQ